MKKLYYVIQITCLFLALPVSASTLAVHSMDVFAFDGKATFSTMAQQTESDVDSFLMKSQAALNAYLHRVILFNHHKISYQRNKSAIEIDLSNIVNYHLDNHYPGLNKVFNGFSKELIEEILSLDQKKLPKDFTSEMLDDLIDVWSDDLHKELKTFASHKTKKSKLLPYIEAETLYTLDVSSQPVLDPRTGSPLLEDDQNNLNNRIVQMLESNNRLIHMLGLQMTDLQQEMIELKRESNEYRQEFSDIHQRIDGLEEAINDIRTSNQYSSTAPGLKPAEGIKKTKLLFDKNSTTIDFTYLTELNQVYERLKQNPSYRIIITGYADKSGNEELNNKISRLRALTVSRYFLKKGIEKNRLLMNFVGDTQSNKETKSDRKVEIEWLTE